MTKVSYLNLRRKIEIEENGIYIVFGVTRENRIRLLHFSALPFREEELRFPEKEDAEKMLEEGFQPVQLNFSGYDRPFERHGNKYVVTAPGWSLKFAGMEDRRNRQGRYLVIREKCEESGAFVESFYQFYSGIPVVRIWQSVRNEGAEDQTLEYISTFSCSGIGKGGEKKALDKLSLLIPHNGWQKELNWREYTLCELGMPDMQKTVPGRSSKTVEVTNTGNWSAKNYLPMGCLRDRETGEGLIWQIEHNGSWHYEIADQNGYIVLNLSGPTEIQSHFSRRLKPGESFVSVPAAVGVFQGRADNGFAALTRYRRVLRRRNEDNVSLPVIFNDYMNCLFADPTTEKEFPLIDAAAEAGCEYFVIDAGWYAGGDWWDSVGAYEESRERFPGGLKEVTDYIREKGMIPGIWLEIEVMGIHSPKVKEMPEDAFFTRHGKRVYDRSRFQLDFRCQAVVRHADEVIDRVIRDYGVGYIKMDYNIEPGIGTERAADSFGDGLLQHERAYLKWLDGVFERYPDLVVENCSSGGLRMDYALLSRCSVQSTSDQEDFRSYAMISANAPTAVAPEQAAVWSYPLKDAGREECVFNMVNAMMLRIHQSGHLAEISEQGFALVKEGIGCYKAMRGDIRRAVPYWPLGLAKAEDDWLCLGLWNPGKQKGYLAVWKRGGEETEKEIPLLPEDMGTYRRMGVPVENSHAPGKDVCTEAYRRESTGQERKEGIFVHQIYPREEESRIRSCGGVSMVVRFPDEIMARIFQVDIR